MPNIYVINQAAHDYSAALDHGEQIIYLSTGRVGRYATNQMFRQFSEKLASSKPEDFILTTSLTTMNIIACCIFSQLHGKVNLLLFKDGRYIQRTLDFSTLSILITE